MREALQVCNSDPHEVQRADEAVLEREGVWRENLKAAESCAARKGDCSAFELGTQQK